LKKKNGRGNQISEERGAKSEVNNLYNIHVLIICAFAICKKNALQVIGKKKNIAVLLSGIFLFPIFFQSLHIASHHHDEPGCIHSCCHTDHSQSMSEIFSKTEKACLLCEYEFSINDVPEISHLRVSTPIINGSFQERNIQVHFQEVSSYKSSRAPPAILS
jgi:hypothetical protein